MKMNQDFINGFEKNSAWYHRAANKLIGKVTKSHYVYHGTSADRALNIAKKGLKATGEKGSRKGITDVVSATLKERNKGLAFTSNDPDIARLYAKQQDGLEKVKKARDFIKKTYGKYEGKIPKKFDNYKKKIEHAGKALDATEAKRVLAGGLARTPLTKGKVIKFKIPKAQSKIRTRLNPESSDFVTRMSKATDDINSLGHEAINKIKNKKIRDLAHGTLSKYNLKKKVMDRNPYRYDRVLKGSLSPKFIKNVS